MVELYLLEKKMASVIPMRNKVNNRSKPTRLVPDTFELTDELIAWTRDKAPNLSVIEEIEIFKDHEFKRPYTDWSRVWRNWVRNWVKYQKRDTGRDLSWMFPEDRKAIEG